MSINVPSKVNQSPGTLGNSRALTNNLSQVEGSGDMSKVLCFLLIAKQRQSKVTQKDGFRLSNSSLRVFRPLARKQKHQNSVVYKDC